MRILFAFALVTLVVGCGPKPDPRIAHQPYSDAQKAKLLAQVNALQGAKKQCVNDYLSEYQQKVKAHCQDAGYAQNIRGKCQHIAKHALHTEVLQMAYNQCNQ